MENLKQISVKIDPVTLQKIDETVKQLHYYKRNSVINNVLTALFFNADSLSISKLVRYWRHGGNKLKIEISEDSFSK